jgi:hypothetical protein
MKRIIIGILVALPISVILTGSSTVAATTGIALSVQPVLSITKTDCLDSTNCQIVTVNTNSPGYTLTVRAANSATPPLTYRLGDTNNKYANLSTTDTQIYHTDEFPPPVNQFKFHFGTNADSATTAGTYTATIIYTVTAEAIPVP